MTIQANQGFGVSIFGATSAGGGGSTSPGGSSGQIQYNASGSFAGMAGTSWNDTTRSLTLTGATVTTSQPVLNLTQTWNAGAVTFTGLKFNATDTASAAGSLLLDLQVGGTSKASVDKSGTLQLALGPILLPNFGGTGRLVFRDASSNNVLYLGQDGTNGVAARYYSFSTNPGALSADIYLTRAAAATLQLGAADAAAPVAQTLQVQSVVAGTTNTAGTNWTLKGSAGTGTGAGGSLIFQVAPAGSSGTAQNAYATALTLGSDRIVTVATTINAGTFANSGGQGITATTSQLGLFNTGLFGWTGNAGSAGTLDTILARDAANTLALRNGTSAQTFRVYNTYTDASNNEYLTLDWSSGANVATIGTVANGTGSVRTLQLKSAYQLNLYSAAGASMFFFTNGSPRWYFDGAAGHLLANADNTYDIGASGATRPRNVYVGGNIIAGGSLGLQLGNVAAPIYWSGRSQIYSPANGNIQLTNAATSDFGRLQFGGTTSSFPALKRNSAELQVRLADDTGYATIDGQLRAQGTAPASATATGTAGDIRYDSSYIYVCTASNTWVRAAIATW